MLNASAFRALVSGRRRGPTAAFLRGVLLASEVPYSLAVRLRNRRYDRGTATTHRVEVPVVCVGNLTLGGTGKSPMVAWIARWLRERAVRVAVISRGYGAQQGCLNDEARELEQKLPDVPHLQNPDRLAAARVAIDELAMQCLLMDDGFQHRRLQRDLDIVLLDAAEPFGFGHVFPRGTLREPVSGLARADVVALSRADMASPEERNRLRAEVERLAPRATWCELAHQPCELLDARGENRPLDELRGRRVAAFCGIGNPAGFRHTLEVCGMQVVALREFADHYAYARGDVESLAAWAEAIDAEAIVCTHKDLVKIGIDRLGGKPLWAVTVELAFTAGQREFETHLQSLLARIAVDPAPA